MQDNSHKTAITRTSLSLPAKVFRSYLKGDTLDFGCGKGSDADELGIDKYDPKFFQVKPTKMYDNVMLIYVLNTVKHAEDVLKWGLEYLKPGGLIMLACRTAKEIDKCAKKGGWEAYRYGGWTTGKGTFQKGYTVKDLREIVGGGELVASGEGKFSYVIIRRQFMNVEEIKLRKVVLQEKILKLITEFKLLTGVEEVSINTSYFTTSEIGGKNSEVLHNVEIDLKL